MGKFNQVRTMAPFRTLMNDTVSLLKATGERIDGIKAHVQSALILIADTSLPIEEGDKLHRTLPNSLVESYLVLDRGFYAAVAGIPAHFQVKVQKESAIARQAQPQTVIYNLQGANPRVNVNSVDSSTNIITVEREQLFDQLREVVSREIKDSEIQEKMLRKATEMESAAGTNSYVEKYKEFMALAADHMTVLAPLLPGLSQLLGG